MPGKHRSARNRQIEKIPKARAEQPEQHKERNESVDDYPEVGRGQICLRSTARPGFDRHRDGLTKEKRRQCSDDQIEGLDAEAFSCEDADHQWAENEHPRTVILRKEYLFAKIGGAHADNYIRL